MYTLYQHTLLYCSLLFFLKIMDIHPSRCCLFLDVPYPLAKHFFSGTAQSGGVSQRKVEKKVRGQGMWVLSSLNVYNLPSSQIFFCQSRGLSVWASVKICLRVLPSAVGFLQAKTAVKKQPGCRSRSGPLQKSFMCFFFSSKTNLRNQLLTSAWRNPET